jgi:hypothetical protein
MVLWTGNSCQSTKLFCQVTPLVSPWVAGGQWPVALDVTLDAPSTCFRLLYVRVGPRLQQVAAENQVLSAFREMHNVSERSRCQSFSSTEQLVVTGLTLLNGVR